MNQLITGGLHPATEQPFFAESPQGRKFHEGIHVSIGSPALPFVRCGNPMGFQGCALTRGVRKGCFFFAVKMGKTYSNYSNNMIVYKIMITYDKTYIK